MAFIDGFVTAVPTVKKIECRAMRDAANDRLMIDPNIGATLGDMTHRGIIRFPAPSAIDLPEGDG